MNYTETLNFLYNQLPMFQRIGGSAYKNNLNNTIALDNYFGHPHNKFKTIHVAGTNGKGSVSHSLASILHEAGYKVGLYTSPHLKDFRERIKINGKMIFETYVTDFMNKNLQYINSLQPSFFELTVALAFDYFASQNIDIAVVEVGMGGRLDSTNIIKPLVSVITNISYDHTQFLGDTLEKIASEKAGIIKKNIPVVVGETNYKISHVFYDKANEVDAPIFLANHTYSINSSFVTSDSKQSFNIFKNGEVVYSNLKLDLLGDYQKENILTILQTVEILQNQKLKISEVNIYSGLANVVKNTGLQGRWQILNNSPLTICDTGHNEAGIEYIVNQIKNTRFDNLHFVIGAVNDKEITKILKLLPKDAVYYFTKASIPRALDEKELQKQANDLDLRGESFSTVKSAYESAKSNAKNTDLIFIGGSTFVVAEVL